MDRRIAATGFALLLLLGVGSAARAAERQAPDRRCSALVGATLGPGAKVTRAEPVPAGPFRAAPNAPELTLPPHCAVRGLIDPHTGPDGKAYGIEFAVNLPAAWNGRFLYQGGGGLNGVVNPPLGLQATGARSALARGFAVASSDSGHKGAGFDRSFMADQEAAMNFAYASVARTAPVAKAVTALYYGRPAARSYFVGCSTGGREAMIAAQRYPAEFDGIIAGAPAMRAGHSNLALAFAAVAFNQVADKDAAGAPIPGTAFSPADKALVVKGILADCDALDGLADGMVFAARACRFDPRKLQCRDAKADGCLSVGQVQAILTAFAGPKSESGRAIYPAYPFDTGVAVDAGPLPGFLPSARSSPLGPPSRAMSLDLEAREAAINADGLQRLQDSAFLTNLGSYFGRGAKLILYHGLSDPWFSAFDTADWFERMGETSPAAADGAALFLSPGMGHCQGGPSLDQFDLLGPLVDWVETGKRPERVSASGPGFPGRTRPLCPYPAIAVYRGSGDPEDERNFTCRTL